ncbi:multidrug ABC transporter [Spirochaetia bacterium]|nr:multidrug ABC transporter [Spirochaetia bacterium]
MKDLICLCARRPVTVIMVMAALLVAAGFSLSVLPLDRLPEISSPRVTVEARYPGMGAEDLRSLVTVPLEDALSPVKGLERIRSVSRDGASVTVLDFRWGIDPNGAAVLVREAIDAVYPSLPQGVQKPLVLPGDPDDEPHAVVAIRSRSGDQVFARNLAEYELRTRFRRIDGAGAVVLTGGENSEARIRLDLPRLISLGMDAAGLSRLLAAETAEIPAGSGREGDIELVVISSARPESLEEFSRFLLPSGSGLQLSDLGELKREGARRKSLFIYNNTEQTALEIYRRPGTDPVRLSRNIKKALEEAIPLFERDAEISLVYDSSPSIIRGLQELILSAGLGALAVILTLVFFLRRLRYSLLTAIAIPFSAAAALVVLALAGKSLNGMSFGGLALGIGLVSDTSVITLDLLHRTFEERRQRPQPEELGLCVGSIAVSSFAGTLTTAAVFIPIIFLPGPLGALFSECSLALVSSITAGWLYAQCGLPVLYRIFYKPVKMQKRPEKMEGIYGRFLKKSLRNFPKIFAAAVLVSAAGIVLLLSRPAVFIAPGAVREIEVSLLFSPGTRLEAMLPQGIKVSEALSDVAGISTFFGRAGTEDEDTGRRSDPDYQKERLFFRCMLQEGANSKKVMEEIQSRLANIDFSGTEITVAFPMDRSERLLGLSSSRTLVLRGSGREELNERILQIKKNFTGDFSSGEIRIRPSGMRPELRVIPRREIAALLGISSVKIAETLYAATEGMYAGSLEIEGRPLDIRLSGNISSFNGNSNGNGPEAALENLPIALPKGGPVFLGTLGKIERNESEAALARLDRSDAAYLDIQSSKVIDELLKTTPGISRADESVFVRYKTSLLLTVFLVLMLLYMTMAAQFESFSLPPILMLSIPFSLAGSGPALFISGSGLDSGSVLGLVVLFGLVVNNGIVLYEVSEEKLLSGSSAVKAVYCGSRERFRPILITTLTTIFALLPLAVSPFGSSQQSMAAAMLGGIIASTFISLFVLPPVFIRFLRNKNRGNKNAR